MRYDTMTDKELVREFYLKADPLESLAVAEHIKDDELRKKLKWEARVMYERDEYVD